MPSKIIKKLKQSNKQISISSLSSIVAGVSVCACACRFACRLVRRARARTCLQGKSSSEGFFFFFFSHLPLLGKRPSPALGAADSPSLLLGRTHRALSYSTGTKEIQASAVQHEIHKISFPSVSRTQLVTAGCKRSREAVEKAWERLLFGAPGKKEAVLPGATWVPSPAAAGRPAGG